MAPGRCVKCGADLPPHGAVCANCGAEIKIRFMFGSEIEEE